MLAPEPVPFAAGPAGQRACGHPALLAHELRAGLDVRSSPPGAQDPGAGGEKEGADCLHPVWEGALRRGLWGPALSPPDLSPKPRYRLQV